MLEHFPTEKKLHTDILEEYYGEIHSEVSVHNEQFREADLVDKEGITRTYALTFLTFDRKNEELSEINEEIKNGGLIGKSFRKHCYTIKKNVIDVIVLDIPESLRKKFNCTETQAKARLSEFYAKKEGSSPVIYGEVLEVYTPDFRPATINAIDRAQVNPTTEAFSHHGISIDEVWKRLDKSSDENEWRDKQAQFDEALEETQDHLAILHERIKSHLEA